MKLLLLALAFAAGCTLLRGQTTDPAGSVPSVSLDNTQPSLTLSPILVGSGLYPSRGGGFTEYTGDDSYFIGEVRYFTGNTTFGQYAPWTNGSLITIASNSALFSIVGTQFGGNGTTNFAVPDLRGRTARHPAGAEAPGNQGGPKAKPSPRPGFPPTAMATGSCRPASREAPRWTTASPRSTSSTSSTGAVKSVSLPAFLPPTAGPFAMVRSSMSVNGSGLIP